MPGGRRGLVAPQNTFLENIIRRSSSRKYLPTEYLHIFHTLSIERFLNIEFCKAKNSNTAFRSWIIVIIHNFRCIILHKWKSGFICKKANLVFCSRILPASIYSIRHLKLWCQSYLPWVGGVKIQWIHIYICIYIYPRKR